MATYADFINDVVPECPGVPVPVVIRAIREAFRTFCRDSTAYRLPLTGANLAYSGGVYTVTPPTGFMVESIVSPMVFDGSYTVYTFSDGSQSVSPTPPIGQTLVSTDVHTINATQVKGASPEWMDINNPGWRTADVLDHVNWFVMKSPTDFVLSPDSGTDRKSNLTVTAVLQPDRGENTVLDDEFCNRWFDYLTAGAKYLLMVMPEVEWANEKLSNFYRAKFYSGIEEALKRARTGNRNPLADGIQHVRGHYK